MTSEKRALAIEESSKREEGAELETGSKSGTFSGAALGVSEEPVSGSRTASTSKDAALVALSGVEERPRAPRADDPAERRSQLMALVGIVIFCVSMGVSWWMAYLSWQFVAMPLSTEGTSATGAAISAVKDGGDPNLAVFMTRVLEADVHLKAIANKQSIVMATITAGFGLFALGFSLFIMGMRGALSLAGPSNAGQIVLRTTSPGLVCFVLGAALIGYAASKETSLRFEELKFAPKGAPSDPPDIGDGPAPPDVEAVKKALRAGGAQ